MFGGFLEFILIIVNAKADSRYSFSDITLRFQLGEQTSCIKLSLINKSEINIPSYEDFSLTREGHYKVLLRCLYWIMHNLLAGRCFHWITIMKLAPLIGKKLLIGLQICGFLSSGCRTGLITGNATCIFSGQSLGHVFNEILFLL